MREQPPALRASSATYRRRCGSRSFGLKPVQVVTRHGQPAEGHPVASCGHPTRRARPAGNPGCFRQPSEPSMSHRRCVRRIYQHKVHQAASGFLHRRRYSSVPHLGTQPIPCVASADTDCSAVLLRDGSCVTAIPPQGIPVAPRGRPRPALSAPRGDTPIVPRRRRPSFCTGDASMASPGRHPAGTMRCPSQRGPCQAAVRARRTAPPAQPRRNAAQVASLPPFGE